MKHGMIYRDWAIIIELEDSDNIKDVMRKSGLNYFIRDWQKKINGKIASKKLLITDKNLFLSYLKNFKNEQSEIEKTFWEIEMNKINQSSVNQELTYYPRVSVILASYNSSGFLNNSVRSIIKQNYKNIELIIIDDCSTDNSHELALNLKNKYEGKIANFQVLKNEQNMGVYYSRNLGINNSTGEIIAIQDADDISDINRLQVSVYELINSQVEFILANGPRLEDVYELYPVLIAMATLVVCRDFFNKYGLYDETTRHSGDLEILDRAHFKKFGSYEMDNFWYWLNYNSYKEGFYKHIYENLYYVREEKNSITKKNSIKKRIEYLNERRKIEKNKMF